MPRQQDIDQFKRDLAALSHEAEVLARDKRLDLATMQAHDIDVPAVLPIAAKDAVLGDRVRMMRHAIAPRLAMSTLSNMRLRLDRARAVPRWLCGRGRPRAVQRAVDRQRPDDLPERQRHGLAAGHLQNLRRLLGTACGIQVVDRQRAET